MIRSLTHIGRWSLPAFLAGMALAGEVSAGGIVVLKSDELSSYNQAREGVIAALPRTAELVEYTISEHVSEARRIGQAVRVARPDVVIAIGLRAAIAAKLEIPDSPTIFCLVLFPEQYGLPTANMIGVSMQVSADEQVRHIRSIAPAAKRIGLVHSDATSVRFLADAKRQAKMGGLNLFTVGVSSAGQVPAAVKNLPTVDLLWIIPDPTVVTGESMEFLLAYSFESRMPLFAFSPALVQHGAVAATYLDPQEVGLQVGGLAARMFRREGRALLGTVVPAEQPRLAVNLRSAAHFGLSVSERTLQAASARFGAGSLAQSDVPPLGP